MPTPRLEDDEVLRRIECWQRNHRQRHKAAAELGISKPTLDKTIKVAAERGLFLDDKPAMPGFQIARVSTQEDENGNVQRRYIVQKPETGEEFEVPAGHAIKGISALVGADGTVSQQWIKTAVDTLAREEAFAAYVEGLKDDLPRVEATSAPAHTLSELLSQYTYTDAHFGMLAWHEETGADYDLKEAERLLMAFISSAVEMSPASGTAVLAQLGDFLHYDSHKSVTPEHGHILDTDSRYEKIVRVAIRVLRWTIARLLEHHGHVHVIMADANHDPAGGVWLREMFAAFYEDEPRVSVDTSASTFYAYQHGDTALFYHHGHRRSMKDVDGVFAGRFRELYGTTKHAYAHLGHLHQDELRTSNLMKIERHATMAAPDAYAANGGFPSRRSAKVIHYHKRFGEVSRSVITPEMLAV